ncbi:hypothetical protein [Neorhizobium sp. DT-125]|uniref:hypothetical protein n=1 Tax=Neorhizobium sp. DT-125 TaxID=3396163 RepID=UPI003F1CB292
MKNLPDGVNSELDGLNFRQMKNEPTLAARQHYSARKERQVATDDKPQGTCSYMFARFTDRKLARYSFSRLDDPIPMSAHDETQGLGIGTWLGSSKQCQTYSVLSAAS